MSLDASLLIGKKIIYKYQYHPKETEAIVLDKIDATEEGTYDSYRMQRGNSLPITKYLVQRTDTNNTLLITPDMVKRILD